MNTLNINTYNNNPLKRVGPGLTRRYREPDEPKYTLEDQLQELRDKYDELRKEFHAYIDSTTPYLKTVRMLSAAAHKDPEETKKAVIKGLFAYSQQAHVDLREVYREMYSHIEDIHRCSLFAIKTKYGLKNQMEAVMKRGYIKDCAIYVISIFHDFNFCEADNMKVKEEV